jgi:hypothetical protein
VMPRCSRSGTGCWRWPRAAARRSPSSPASQTLASLAREIPRAAAFGYEFVPVSYLLDRAGRAPSRPTAALPTQR